MIKKYYNNKKAKKEFKFNYPFKPRLTRPKYISTINIVILILFSLLIYYLFRYIDVDRIMIAAVIALIGISTEIFGQIFAYVLSLIQSIPYIGPMVAKVITWPIFITLNVMAYFVSLIVIRFKGIAMVKDARVLTTVFLFGLLVGFILGRLF